MFVECLLQGESCISIDEASLIPPPLVVRSTGCLIVISGRVLVVLLLSPFDNVLLLFLLFLVSRRGVYAVAVVDEVADEGVDVPGLDQGDE